MREAECFSSAVIPIPICIPIPSPSPSPSPSPVDVMLIGGGERPGGALRHVLCIKLNFICVCREEGSIFLSYFQFSYFAYYYYCSLSKSINAH